MTPDPAQQAVLDYASGPLLVLAGPGTGKTTTLVELVARRIEQGADPQRLLLLTFSRRAAGELRARLAARLAAVAPPPAASTFHAFALGLLRRFDPDPPHRLVGGPAQDAVVRELLRGDVADGYRDWPASLHAALPTWGFAQQLRDLLAAAQHHDLPPAELSRYARRHRRPEWRAAGRFFATYLDVLAAQGEVDYAELINRAAVLAEPGNPAAVLRDELDLVVVDEYQDTDLGQERLLRALAGGGRNLVVVGDPDQAIYGFRGAQVANLLEFPQRFRCTGGSPAPVLTLQVSRRLPPGVLVLSRGVAARLPVPGLPTAAVRAHRALTAGPPAPAPTPVPVPVPAPSSEAEVRALHLPTAEAEAEGIADVLRAAHLRDGVPWSQMAVLVRSAPRSIPLLARSLTAAGVPLIVASAEHPLVGQPIVADLLAALRAVTGLAAVDDALLAQLLVGPLVGMAPRDLGRLQRTVGSLAPLVDDPAQLPASLAPHLAAPVRRLAKVFAAGRDGAGLGVEAALWRVWEASELGPRWSRTALGSSPAARGADTALDAVVAMFDVVEQVVADHPAAGPAVVIEEILARELPAGLVGERAGLARDGVALLTAHRSKGLEWDLVVIAGLTEGVWPDLRGRGGVLDVADFTALASGRTSGLPRQVSAATARAAALTEERRLFYVAMTRARRRLVLTCAAGSDGADDDVPSRFLAELGVVVEQVLPDTLGDPGLRLVRLAAELRRVLLDPETPPALAQGAAEQLALLAQTRGEDGTPLCPSADPDTWWGLAPVSSPDLHRPPGATVALSATALRGLATCPVQRLLRRELGAGRAGGTALRLGNLLHVLAEDVTAGRRPADLAELERAVREAVPDLEIGARWQREYVVAEAVAALRRFLNRHARTRDAVIGTEMAFEAVLSLPHGPVQLRGAVDRVERTPRGARVVDLKTGTTAATRQAAQDDPQLAVYQLLIAERLLPGVEEPPDGAELWQLRFSRGDGPLLGEQTPLDEGSAAVTRARLDAAAELIRNGVYRPAPGPHCRSCDVRVACPAHPAGRPVLP